jgi:tetratricopeptide (TPR) repeat protein
MSETAAPSLLGRIAGYTEILAKDPHSTIFVQLSETYRQMGMLDDALEIASKGIQAHPTYAPGHTVLGRIQGQRGARSEAVAAFEKALELDGENLAALKGLAGLRLQSGDKEQARLLLLRVAAIKPDDAAVKKTLNSLAGTPSASRPAANNPLPPKSQPPSPPSSPSSPKAGAPISTPTIAEIYIKQGFPKRALKVYRDLLEADPHNEMIRQKLVALKRSLAAEARPDSREIPAEPSAVSGQDLVAGTLEPEKTKAKSGDYPEKLELWLTSIQKRREHVQ